MRFLATLVLCLFTAAAQAAGPFAAGAPASTDNDSSCDISLLPAATLLLPYFEVDINAAPGSGETTIFTITNTANLPQAVQVTLWTDFDYPVMGFSIYLTGYDVQSINLYDVIVNGRIAPNGTGFDVSPVGELSGTSPTAEFDNPLLTENTCTNLATTIPASFVDRVKTVLTTGKLPSLGASPGCNTAGGTHTNAVGYATIDVVGACDPRFPTDAAYYTSLLRFDNVLGGDYMQVHGSEDFAQGSPMVHIRAIPEGGTAQSRADKLDFRTHLERTFYGRFQAASTPKLDARQPLPATFAARWISGGPGGFETFYKIWREGRAPAGTPCSAFPARAEMNFVEAVRFDEDENPEISAPGAVICTPISVRPTLPSASLTNVENDTVYPSTTTGAVGGWMYLNLDYCNRDDIAGQNWVVTSMRAEGRFSVDVDALALGNGCTAPIAASEATSGSALSIGPAPNGRP